MRPLLLLLTLPALSFAQGWGDAYKRTVPCEVQGNRPAAVVAPKCATCGPKCVCVTCGCPRVEAATPVVSADRLARLLALPAVHRLPDGTEIPMTLGESMRAGGNLTPAYVAWAGLTDAEATAVRAAKDAPAAVVVHPVAEPMPVYVQPTYISAPAPVLYGQPTYTNAAPTRSFGLGFTGPRGAGFFAGYQAGGNCAPGGA